MKGLNTFVPCFQILNKSVKCSVTAIGSTFCSLVDASRLLKMLDWFIQLIKEKRFTRIVFRAICDGSESFKVIA